MTKIKTPRKKKEKIPPEPHWKSAIVIWFTFSVSKWGEDFATFSLHGSHSRDLKIILACLRENAEKLGCAWTKKIACDTLFYFLNFSWRYKDVPVTFQWFLPFASKNKEEILNAIQQLKFQKLNREIQNTERN